ncbi:MAG TPA: hypothetical protein VMT98_00705 [Verrucomicrobiae bacterium]|nr:hypothetical protein [Verrucomicrobiae bacterium]
MAGIRDYSTTPANNVALFPEGMAPSQVNDSARQLQADVRDWYNDAEWVIYGDGDGAHGIAYASATGFSVVGTNVAAVYHTGRRVKAVGALTGTIYGTIASSAFATNTAVTVTWDAGALQNEALTVYLGILSRANSALPANAARTDIATTYTAPQIFNGAVTLGAALNEAAEIPIASAATVNIGAAASSNLLITGSTAITNFGAANAGIRRLLRFAGALTLTHNATSLILPGNTNIITAVNDTAEFLSLGAGNWICVGYKRQDTPGANNQSAATYTVTANDAERVVRLTSAGAVTVTLPAISSIPAGFRFLLINAAGGNVLVNRAGADQFEGGGTSVTVQNADGRRMLAVWTDGATWYTSERRFRSAQQAIVFGSRYTIAHGLGAVPRLDRIAVTMKCLTSERNYEVGDEIAAPIVTHFSSAAGGFGGNVQVDSVNIYYDLGANGIFIGDETNFTSSTITPANWEIYVHASY